MQIIVAIFTDRVEAYKSVPRFCDAYPEHSKDTIYNYLSRRNEPYKRRGLKVVRTELQ